MVDSVYMDNVGTALLLVCMSSILHGTWNALLKRAKTSSMVFTWTYSAWTTPLWSTILIYSLSTGTLGATWWPATISAILHTTYAVILQWAYTKAPLTTVYPISRGISPTLITIAKIPRLGMPYPTQILALPIVLLGVLLSLTPTHSKTVQVHNLWPGLIVASCITSYTLWDSFSVSHLNVNIISYIALSSLFQFSVLTAALVAKTHHIPTVTTAIWKQTFPVSILVPTSYFLILAAMNYAPPSTISVLRCANIVLGSLIGAWMLKEKSVKGAYLV